MHPFCGLEDGTNGGVPRNIRLIFLQGLASSLRPSTQSGPWGVMTFQHPKMTKSFYLTGEQTAPSFSVLRLLQMLASNPGCVTC